MHCRYYQEVLRALASFPFYNTYVHLPPHNVPIPDYIRDNPKFFPYFANVLGAIDGTHIRCCPFAIEPSAGLTWYSTTSWWDGMGLPQTHTCTTMHG